MFLNNFCNCPDNCDTVLQYGVLDVDQNCTPKTYLSEICGVVILPSTAAKPTDWTSSAAWDAVINNSDTNNLAGKYLVGIGNIDSPEKNTITVGKQQQVTTSKLFTLTFAVYNLSDNQYEFLRSLQCDPKNYSLWYNTASEHIFGGAEGITPVLTDVDFIYASGEESVEVANLTFQWRTEGCDPDRTQILNFDANFAQASTLPAFIGFGSNNAVSLGNAEDLIKVN